MAYDEELADRIRELLGGERRLTEKRMFGGLGFLIGGNMAIAASGQGGLLVRVDPVQSEKLVATSNARPMEMRGRQMQGCAAGRRGGYSHQVAARQVGTDRRGVRALPPTEIGRARLSVKRSGEPGWPASSTLWSVSSAAM